MKKGFYAALCAVMMLCASCHDSIWDAINALDGRVAKLEELCKEMNTNISSLKTIVDVMQSNDYITGITEIKKGNEVIGYTITFGKHAPITIYNGEDGKNGADGLNGKDGTDGKDGHTPIITVAQDEDGVYYWKMDGKWLTDEQGNKMRVTGENGQDGVDGKDGKDGKDGADGKDGQDGNDGANGQDGQDGVTPQLKIENDYWYISYNGGTSWIQLGKAVGENGKDGKDGQDGKDGDSMFKSVTQDDTYVYFTLADSSVIKIHKNNLDLDIIGFGTEMTKVDVQDGAIMVAFSISNTQKVYFSKGNLQFNANIGTHQCADGTTKAGTWRFANTQYGEFGACRKSAKTYDAEGWFSTFGWGTSGWNNGNTYYLPTDTEELESNTTNRNKGYGYGPTDGTNYTYSLVGDYAYSDWGVYNAISNGGNQPNQWRTLTSEEWNYLLCEREHAHALFSRARIRVSADEWYYGLVLFPDDFYCEGINFLPDASSFDINIFSLQDWLKLENYGAVFLPSVIAPNTHNVYYWATDIAPEVYRASAFAFSTTSVNPTSLSERPQGNYVRLVKDVE